MKEKGILQVQSTYVFGDDVVEKNHWLERLKRSDRFVVIEVRGEFDGVEVRKNIDKVPNEIVLYSNSAVLCLETELCYGKASLHS